MKTGMEKAAATRAKRRSTRTAKRSAATRAKRSPVSKGRGSKAKVVSSKDKVVSPRAIPRRAEDMPRRLPSDAPKLVSGKRNTIEMARWLFKDAYYEDVSMSSRMREMLEDGRLDSESMEFNVVATRDVLNQLYLANVDNRDLRSSNLKSMALDMVNKNFKQTIAIPFIFGWDGHGLDYQHRIVTFLEAMDILGIDHIVIKVILGMDPMIRFYLDQGSSRSVADQLKYMKVAFACKTSAAVSRSRAYELMINGKRPIGCTKGQADRVAAMKPQLDQVHYLLLQRGARDQILPVSNQVAKNAGTHAAFMRGIELYGDIVEKVAIRVGKGSFRTGSALYALTQWSEDSEIPKSGDAGIDASFRMAVGTMVACRARKSVDHYSELMVDDATLADFLNGKLFKKRR